MSSNPFAEITAARNAQLATELAREQETDLQVTMQHNAFAQSGVMALWEELKDILVPHYNKEFQVLQIPLGKFGSYARRRELPIGLNFYPLAGYKYWGCKFNRSMCKVTYRSRNSTFADAEDMRKDFVAYLAQIIPRHALDSFQSGTSTAAKGRRLLMSPA